MRVVFSCLWSCRKMHFPNVLADGFLFVCAQVCWHSQERRQTGIIHQPPHICVHPLISELKISAAQIHITLKQEMEPVHHGYSQSSISTVTCRSSSPKGRHHLTAGDMQHFLVKPWHNWTVSVLISRYISLENISLVFHLSRQGRLFAHLSN